ncbi:MAG TPA: signal peptidase I [Candidatus Limnocylindrales bacterium]
MTPPEPATPSTERPRRGAGCLFEIVETVVLTLVIFFVVQTFVAQPYKVEGASMEQTLAPSTYLLIDKLTPRWAPYQRGDIVVFNPPPNSGPTGVPFVKRVIGLPGDHVELRDGVVYVNGVALSEPYTFADGADPRTDPLSDTSSWVVPAGDLFLLGDHRNDSEDSRAFGPVAISDVIGRAWLRYWPIGTFGTISAPSYAVPSPAP